MGYEEILDGEEHWLSVDMWPGWTVPHLLVGAVVEMDPQPVHDPLEGPLENLVTVPNLNAESFFTGRDEGWGALSIMLQAFADCLDMPIDVAQYVSRDGKWKVNGVFHKVQFGVGSVRGGGSRGYDDQVDIAVDLPDGL